MAGPGLGHKRLLRNKSRVLLEGLPRDCRGFFLDSGAHSLYHKYIKTTLTGKMDHSWFWRNGEFTPEFRIMLDSYASFIKLYGKGIDHYATLDVIYNPELSWKSLKYLENYHGLKPVPVIPLSSHPRWMDKYLDAGYKYIGLPCLAQRDVKQGYVKWADEMFNRICDTRDRLPGVKIHGFGVGSVDMMRRYPWYSVDSSSPYKYAGNGWVCVPHKRKGEFTFDVDPYIIGISDRSSARKKANRHYYNLSPKKQEILKEWLELIDVPLGKMIKNRVIEYGVTSEYHARAVACLRFYQMLLKSIPPWPWPFGKKLVSGFFPLENLR